jgi:hypothetical protein
MFFFEDHMQYKEESKILSTKSQTISNDRKKISKIYDLEERTLQFAKETIDFINNVPKTLPNIEICKQLVRSAGSVGANYIEANESLGKKRF